jgi:hypothetical protein
MICNLRDDGVGRVFGVYILGNKTFCKQQIPTERERSELQKAKVYVGRGEKAKTFFFHSTRNEMSRAKRSGRFGDSILFEIGDSHLSEYMPCGALTVTQFV